MSEIVLADIRKRFGGDEEVLRGIDLHIKEGEFLVLLGPSGCGKTTLLRLIAGLDTASSGDIHIGDARVNYVPAAKRGLAMVFQSYALYPHMTVRGNLAFGLKLAKLPQSEIVKRVEQVARTLEITQLLERKPRALSGGQRQRVAIGRAIARNPIAFLFDEPLSNLDAALRVQMRLELARLHHRLKTTMIYVTHDQMEAMTLADRIVVMHAGVIQQVGRAMDLYQHPVNRFVAEFIGSPKMNLFPCQGHIKGDRAQVNLGKSVHLNLRVKQKARDGDISALGIRPEHLNPSATQTGDCQGTIKVIEQLGDNTYLYVDVDDLGLVNMRVSPNKEYQLDTSINISFDSNFCHLFAKDGRSLRAHHTGPS